MMHRYAFVILILVLSLVAGGVVFAAETVKFEPVRAPAKGPDSAPVTIVEIADFM